MINEDVSIVLGSRSPRRRELLESVVGAHRLQVLPPANSDELGFDNLRSLDAIAERLGAIVADKSRDVVAQLDSKPASCVVTADTIVVATALDGTPVVLGQPDPDHWEDQVSDWMRQFYSGRCHEVWTGFQVTLGDQVVSQIVRTRVEFRELTPELISWYIGTHESLGKAGGYAIQGAAAALVKAINGSLTNVIGLPVLEVVEALDSFRLNVPDRFAATNDAK